MKHVTSIAHTPNGHLAICDTCGERNQDFTGYGAADLWCTEHEQNPRRNQRGARPGLKMLEKMYRERAFSLVYTNEEREQWLVLANELKARLSADIEGQLGLFGEEEDLNAYTIRNANRHQRGD